MAWRQIPYPPDRPAVKPSGTNVELGSGELSLTIDRETGRGPGLRAGTTELLAREAPGLTFRLYDTRGLYGEGQTVRPARVVQEGPREVVIVYDRPRFGAIEAPVRLVLRVNAPADGSLRFSYEAEHLGGPAVLERFQFPVFTGLTDFAGDETTLLLPFIGGERRVRPAGDEWSDFEYIYPNEAFSFMLLHGPAGGLYLASEDPEFRWTVLRGRRLTRGGPSLELLFETVPFLRAGERFQSQEFVLRAFRGSWHDGADCYRRFMETWYRPVTSRPFVRRLRGLIELFFSFNERGGVVDKDPDELYAYAEQCRTHLGLDVAHLCGYHEGGFDARYPLYHDVLERIGGAAGLKRFVERCHEAGFHSDIYTNCRITDTETDWWASTGSKWACREKDGTYGLEYYNGRYFTVACPSIPERRQLWLDEIRFLLGEIGAEGLQVDQPHTTAREDWAFAEHGHASPFDHWGRPSADFFAAVHALGTSLNPNYWSWGEAASDYFSQFFDISCIYSRYSDQRVSFGETDPGTKDWTYDSRGFGQPELLKYLLPEPIMLQCPVVPNASEEDLFRRLTMAWSFGTMLYWPGHALRYDLGTLPPAYLAYVRRLWDARDRAHDCFVDGRFRDRRGVEVDASVPVVPRLYAAPGGYALALINAGAEDGTVSFRIRAEDPGGDWRWEEVVGLASPGEGRALEGKIRLPGLRSALVVARRATRRTS